MNNVACFRKPRGDIRAEISEQPEYDENYDDPGKHEISPFCAEEGWWFEWHPPVGIFGIVRPKVSLCSELIL